MIIRDCATGHLLHKAHQKIVKCPYCNSEVYTWKEALKYTEKDGIVAINKHISTYRIYPYYSRSNTCRASNIRRVVQQNERNEHLGPFKCWVPKLLNLINFKMVPNIKENLKATSSFKLLRYAYVHRHVLHTHLYN